MVFRFSFSVFPSPGWEVFYQSIPHPIFLLSLPIIRLGGFTPATGPFETHQLPYGARIFSVVSRFSSPVSFIGLGGFSPGFHSRFPFKVPIQDSHSRFFSKFSFNKIPRSAELASKEGGNCNNVTFGAKSSQSRNHVTTTNHEFTSTSLTSITTLGSSSSTPQSRQYVYLWKGIPLDAYWV